MNVWVFGILVGVCITLLLLIILQIIYIRVKLSSMKDSIHVKDMSIRKQYSEQAKSKNQLQVYGVKIDCKCTSALNDKYSVIGNQLLELTAPKQFMIPHVCPNQDGVKHLNVNVKKMGFLILIPNTASQKLLNDIEVGEVRYVVLNSQFFLVHHFDKQDVANLKQIVKEADIPHASNVIENRDIVFLYVLDSKFSVPIFDPNIDTTNCVIQLSTFLNPHNTIRDFNDHNLLDLQAVIGYTNAFQQIPVHVLGYKLL